MITSDFTILPPYWGVCKIGGWSIYASTGKVEKRDAITVMRKAEAKIAEGQHEGPLVRRTRFDDLVADLMTDYEKKGRKTWQRRQQHIAHLRPHFGGMRVAAINSSHLNEYAAKRLREEAAPATVNRELDCLHRMMVLGQRDSPPKVMHIPHFEKLAENNVREGFCDHENYLCIRGAAPYHVQVAATIGYYTGMRKGEILSLGWEKHIDLANQCIRLERKQTKTKAPRVIYMTGDFLKVILKAKEVRDRDYPACPWVVQIQRAPRAQLRSWMEGARKKAWSWWTIVP
jgi:integrase